MNKPQFSKLLQVDKPNFERDTPDQHDPDLDYLRLEVYDIIRTIRDPEKPNTLEELDVVQEDLITVTQDKEIGVPTVKIVWVPTVPDCSLAMNIALCLRTKLFNEISVKNAKIDIIVQEGKHTSKAQIDKQVNDKERVLAAMENEAVKAAIEDLIKERPQY